MNINFNFFSTRYPIFQRFIAFVHVQEKLINNFKIKQRCLFILVVRNERFVSIF